MGPVIVWFRRDLRLNDHPALAEAARSGRPVLPVFIRDKSVVGLGAAPAWRLEKGLESLSRSLAGIGSRLILRNGDADDCLDDLILETGADAVFWTRLYDPASKQRDRAIKASLKSRGVDARSFSGHLLTEPVRLRTKEGGPFRVYSPFWRAMVREGIQVDLMPAPKDMRPPERWPASEKLEAWNLGQGMRRGAAVLSRHVVAGEEAALERLDQFAEGKIDGYKSNRDLVSEAGTSGLSPFLSLGEVSPVRCWARAMHASESGSPGAGTFMKELAWREFAHHLMHHFPDLGHRNWRDGWESFPWNLEENRPDVLAWKQGRTGYALIDAAMRELQVTGTMHNRARMVAASFLTKHLMTDWRVGLRWFEQHLVDWDTASNAMGWQWVAGCGPDAAPFFRIFNPETQAKKFDPDGRYARRWIAEGQADPPSTAMDFFEAIPARWQLSLDMAPAAPIVELADGRSRALAAYSRLTGKSQDLPNVG
ncbi:cryptochrome/photolyase family protein [Primorskyibacter sp. S87]|uniref:cryptochrome/photolyase family protein n=1 Tax=Primorskyibacter sp. S87 TaxID=3415126 RepID=UPI003C7D41B3